MTGKHRLLAIFAIIFLIGFESGSALKCYQCEGDSEKCEAELKEDSVKECPGDGDLTTASTPASTESTPEPTKSTPEPTESTPEPTESTPGPTESTPEPTESTPGPTESTPEPTESTPEPTESTPEPTESTPEPTESTPEPTESTPEPTESTPGPTESTTGPTETTENPDKPAGPEGKFLLGGRQRRSVVDRFFRVNPQTDGADYCFTSVIKKDGKEIVKRGCTKNAKYCDQYEGESDASCRVCQEDKCNSASSNFAAASMLLPLIALVFVTK